MNASLSIRQKESWREEQEYGEGMPYLPEPSAGDAGPEAAALSEEAREAEQLIFDRPDYRRLAESYARMLVTLSTLSDEPVEAPEVSVGYAVRRVYVSAFLRQAEQVVRRLVGDYPETRTSYLKLCPVQPR